MEFSAIYWIKFGKRLANGVDIDGYVRFGSCISSIHKNMERMRTCVGFQGLKSYESLQFIFVLF